jgi:hypothetical protein
MEKTMNTLADAGLRGPAFTDHAVAAAFEAFPGSVRPHLLDIRRLIFDVAGQTSGVGKIQEALRWGQPSYLTAETKSGSTIRLGILKGRESHAVLFVHCQSGLADKFIDLYGTTLRIDGNRAVMFDAKAHLPEPELRHCIGLALTYHARKRGRVSRNP